MQMAEIQKVDQSTKSFKGTTAPAPRRFYEEEKCATGSVKGEVYKTYMKACGGYVHWIFVLLVSCLTSHSVLQYRSGYPSGPGDTKAHPHMLATDSCSTCLSWWDCHCYHSSWKSRVTNSSTGARLVRQGFSLKGSPTPSHGCRSISSTQHRLEESSIASPLTLARWIQMSQMGWHFSCRVVFSF